MWMLSCAVRRVPAVRRDRQPQLDVDWGEVEPISNMGKSRMKPNEDKVGGPQGVSLKMPGVLQSRSVWSIWGTSRVSGSV